MIWNCVYWWLIFVVKKFNWKQDEIVRLTVHGTASIRWWKVKRFTGRVCLSHQNWFGCFIGWWWPISGHWSEFFATSICWHCAANLNYILKSLKKWGKNEKNPWLYVLNNRCMHILCNERIFCFHIQFTGANRTVTSNFHVEKSLRIATSVVFCLA